MARYLITSPLDRKIAEETISKVLEHYGISFTLIYEFPFDLDTTSELSEDALKTFKSAGVKIQRYTYPYFIKEF